MRNVNEHVIQDIQDSIMILGFKKQQQANRKLIDDKVDYLFEFHEKSTSKEDKAVIQEKKKKRKFEQALRPPFVWNFFETRADKEEKTKIKAPGEDAKDEDEEEEKREKAPYLINAFAQPEKWYAYEEKIKENRVKKIQKNIESLAYNLKTHEDKKWKILTNLCIEIFKDMAKEEGFIAPTKK